MGNSTCKSDRFGVKVVSVFIYTGLTALTPNVQ